jgi:uncharacterized iron-regulated membrane protein
MRKWHRWLSVLFGVFLLWIAVTGVLSQIVPLVERGGFENEAQETAERAEVLARATPPGFVCPETLSCQPKRKGGSIVGLLHHLHSGESFGPLGTAIALLSGLTMIFFSFSGLWLYVQMWSNRKDRGLTPRWWWS